MPKFKSNFRYFLKKISHKAVCYSYKLFIHSLSVSEKNFITLNPYKRRKKKFKYCTTLKDFVFFFLKNKMNLKWKKKTKRWNYKCQIREFKQIPNVSTTHFWWNDLKIFLPFKLKVVWFSEKYIYRFYIITSSFNSTFLNFGTCFIKFCFKGLKNLTYLK